MVQASLGQTLQGTSTGIGTRTRVRKGDLACRERQRVGQQPGGRYLQDASDDDRPGVVVIIVVDVVGQDEIGGCL